MNVTTEMMQWYLCNMDTPISKVVAIHDTFFFFGKTIHDTLICNFVLNMQPHLNTSRKEKELKKECLHG